MKTILILLIFLLPINCYADWDKNNTFREIAWQGIHLIDWGQTLDIARQPDRYYEMNPILGKHPSVGQVNTYMAISAITHIGISYMLPKKYRAYWQWISIGVSGSCIINNFNAGLKVKF